jgi:tRNA G46 methylase TrmB
MSEQPFDYDPRDWHSVQAADQMDVSRHFEYDDDAIFQLRKWFRLDQAASKTVVEIGCGGGYFTGKLVAMSSAPSLSHRCIGRMDRCASSFFSF